MRVFMKRCLMAFLFCVALVMTSCSKEEMTIGEIGDKITVTAYVDNSDTKVTSEFNTVENKYTFAWEENDEFSVIRNTDNKTFTKDARENTFTGATVDPEGSGAYYAIHPVTTAVDHTAATFDVSDQSEDAAYVLYSSTNDVNTFKFKHAMAYLRLSLPDEFDGARCDITITTPTGVFTNGEINLGNGTLDYTNSTKNYIKLNRQIDNDNPLLVAIPPMETGNKSLTFSIKKGDDYYEATLDGNPANEIVAGKYYTASIVPTVITPYVTFTAAEAQTLKYVFYHKPYSSELEYTGGDLDIDLEWSNDRHTWTVFGNELVSFGGVTKVYVRARIENGTANADGTAARLDSSTGEPTVWGKFVFGNNSVGVECSGDIRTLIDYRDYENVETNEAKFKKLFSGCKSLKTAPTLPATTLAEYCYSYMFNGCTGLQTAPELPAMTLAEKCYYDMFDGCTSLTTAPALPATTLATSCYGQMFFGCTSLTTAPSLPVTTLAEKCYYNMFNGCKRLTNAPELPATTLAKECYYQMFSGCTSLTTAPSLPATTLAEYCYGSMFSGCTGVEAAPALPATTLQKGCYNAMFSGCTSLTQAPVLRATTMVESCYNQMFSGCTGLQAAPALPATDLAIKCYRRMFFMCTSLATAPALPATTLAEECYIEMFSNCTGLQAAPVLPATTLATSCYKQMFSGCTSLTTAPSLPATTLATSCYDQMFSVCTSLTTAPSLPATTLAASCYNYMFYNCTGLQTAPELPATTLATSCYYYMFNKCTNLNYIKMLATDISASSCLHKWMEGVAATGTFIKAASMTSLPTGVSGIPSGWTITDYGQSEN